MHRLSLYCVFILLIVNLLHQPAKAFDASRVGPVAGVTPYEYAIFSRFVYQKRDVSFPKGWSLFDYYKLPSYCDFTFGFALTPSCAYYGHAYRRGTDIVIAHRGTDNANNKWQDFARLLPGALTDYYDIAKNFVELDVKDEIKKGCPNCTIIAHTGHSLGGHIAELMSATYKLPAVTFDSPGSYTIIKKKSHSLFNETNLTWSWENVVTYNAAPNIVNTMDRHIGPVVRVYPIYDFTSELVLPYTLQQHTMFNITQQFNSISGQPKLFGDMSKMWFFGWPVTGGGIGCFTLGASVNEELNRSYFEIYDKNPYYWEWKFNGIGYNTAKRMKKIAKELGGIGCSYDKSGVEITGENNANSIWGATNYKDSIKSGSGDDSIWSFSGDDYIQDSGGENTYVFYVHNMAGETRINDKDKTGRISFPQLNCNLEGDIYWDHGEKKFVFAPAARKGCNVNMYGSGSKCDSSEKICYDHSTDVIFLEKINNDKDLKISYQKEDEPCTSRYKTPIGGDIIIENFTDGNFGIRLKHEISLSSLGYEQYAFGTNEADKLFCSLDASSRLYGFAGDDVFSYNSDDYYDCIMNGYPYGHKNFTVTQTKFEERSLKSDRAIPRKVSIRGFKAGDLLDLSALKINWDNIKYRVANWTSIFELDVPHKLEIFITGAMRSLGVTFNGQTVENPLDQPKFENITLPHVPDDELFIEPVECPRKPVINVKSLNGQNGLFIRDEQNLLDGLIGGAADFNGDGLADMLVSTRYQDKKQTKVYVIYGSATGFDPVLTVTDLDVKNGITITDDIGHTSYLKIGSPGDVNGDGFDDIQIGTEINGGVRTCIIFGGSQLPTQMFTSQLNGKNGFYIYVSAPNAGFEIGKSLIGDINGDGFFDFAFYNWTTEKKDPFVGIWVVFGRQDFPQYVNADGLNGHDGFKIKYSNGPGTNEGIYTAGDINRDGIDDLYLGYSEGQSPAIVVFGAKTFPAILDLDNPGSQSILKIKSSAVRKGRFGSAGGKIGDFNNDGMDDLFVGSPGSAIDVGSGFVIFGRPEFPAEIDVTGLKVGEGFRITGFPPATDFGSSVSYAGSAGGILADEFIVGAKGTNNWSGAVYRFHNLGRQEFPAEIKRAELTIKDVSVVEDKHPNNALGWQVVAGSDINGDGIGDVTMSVPSSNPFDNGVAVAFGQYICGDDNRLIYPPNDECSTESTINIQDLNGSNGFKIIDRSDKLGGGTLGEQGDVNGDGYADIITRSIKVPTTIYVVYGSSNGFPSVVTVDDLDGRRGFILHDDIGNGSDYVKVGSPGDVNGDGYDDIQIGTGGRDNIRGYIVFGGPSLPNHVYASQLNGSNGFYVKTTAFSGLEIGKGYIGDLNNDGMNEFAFDAGAKIIFGAKQFPQYVDADHLDGKNGINISYKFSANTNHGVFSAGDFNHDGIDDLFLGYSDHWTADVGHAFVIYGSKSLPAAIDLNHWQNYAVTKIIGSQRGSAFGNTGGTIGDFNNDGIDDLFVSASQENGGAGVGYVFFGRSHAPSTLSTYDLNGENGFKITGFPAGGNFGFSYSYIGYRHKLARNQGFVVTAPFTNDLIGKAYVFYRQEKNKFPAVVDISNLSSSQMTTIQGSSPGSEIGWATSSGGDINGDEFPDIVMDCNRIDVCVIFGKPRCL